jgi:hypothetical protein
MKSIYHDFFPSLNIPYWCGEKEIKISSIFLLYAWGVQGGKGRGQMASYIVA